MADLSRVRKNIIVAIVALGVVDAAALVYLALPLRAGAAQPTEVKLRAELEYRLLKPRTVPLQGIDQKLTKAQKDGAAFIQNRLPSRYSDIVEELGKLAVAHHIHISVVSYKTEPGVLPGIEDIEMHAGLAGPYVDLVRFMNAVERDKMFFIIDSVGLTGQAAEKGQSAGGVRLDMKLDTYLRTQS